MSRNILCVIEFDRYPEIVVERATWLAKLYDCNLHLLVCDPVTDFLGDSYVYLLESQDIAESLRSYQDEVVEALTARVEQAGVRVGVNRSRDRQVSNVIRREAAARQPMFVIKGTHYHTPTERASLDGEDWELIRDLDYALWFVKPVDWRDPPVIVAAVDPLNANDKPAYLDHKIIDLARMIAEKCSGEIKVKPVKLPIEELDKKIREEHQKALRVLAETSNIPDKTLHLLPGRAHEVLPAFALEQNASLVVMGALARLKLKLRIIGSTATRALDHIHCDVLVAHGKQD